MNPNNQLKMTKIDLKSYSTRPKACKQDNHKQTKTHVFQTINKNSKDKGKLKCQLILTLILIYSIGMGNDTKMYLNWVEVICKLLEFVVTRDDCARFHQNSFRAKIRKCLTRHQPWLWTLHSCPISSSCCSQRISSASAELMTLGIHSLAFHRFIRILPYFCFLLIFFSQPFW